MVRYYTMKMVLRIALAISCCFLSLLVAMGQKPDPEKARRYFDQALYAFDSGDHKGSIRDLETALKADPTFADAYILMGDNLLEIGKQEEAVSNYRKAIQFNPEYPEVVWNILANTLFFLERYEEACPCYDSVLTFTGIRPDLRETIEDKLTLCHFRKNLIDHPVEFDPVSLGPGVNSEDDEYINAISADGTTLYFTRREATNDADSKEYTENFYYSVNVNGKWDTASLLGYPEGAENDAGALCISPDGNLLVFTSCFRKDGNGSCDLYYSERIGDKWTAARNLGDHINSDLWDAQPSISPDGNTIYFASNRKGGYGSSDIWATRRTSAGGWGKPYNLGPVINTVEAEMAPYIHFDGKTLYYSSKGHSGLGGADLFRSEFSEGRWSDPQNLGHPINTSADELVIIVNPDGATGFISSNNIQGEGGYDIYSFHLYKEIRPVPVTYLKGVVYDEESKMPLRASIELFDIEKDSVLVKAVSGEDNGEFLVCLPFGRKYGLNVASPGYLFYSDHFPLTELKSKADPIVKDIPLSKIKAGNVMVLYNIFFETDQYQLQPASYAELEKLTSFLVNNPGISVEISGHTDNSGTEAYNLDLSSNRAKSVATYLMEKGLDPKRLTSAGYGESRPVATNETEEGKAKNRRTEIRITGIN